MMEVNYTYLGISAAIVAVIAGAAIIFARRHRQDEVPLDIPGTEKDALFDVEPAAAKESLNDFVDRWGDQIVGKAKVIAAETDEERVARIHQEVAQQQALRQAQNRQVSSYAPRAISNYAARQIPTPAAKATTPAMQGIIVLYIMAKESQRFQGYDLYQALINAGLQYGKMKIFHYQPDENKQEVLFSIASAINPGVIDIEQIGNFSTPGLTVFMDSSRVRNPKLAFETMVAVTEQLADDLHGYILDGKRQRWSSEIESECFAQFA